MPQTRHNENSDFQGEMAFSGTVTADIDGVISVDPFDPDGWLNATTFRIDLSAGAQTILGLAVAPHGAVKIFHNISSDTLSVDNNAATDREHYVLCPAATTISVGPNGCITFQRDDLTSPGEGRWRVVSLTL